MTAAIVVLIIVVVGALIYTFRDRLGIAPPPDPDPDPVPPPPDPPYDPEPPPTWPVDPDPVPPPPEPPEPDPPPPLPEYLPRIYGIITDRDTGKAIVGATVTLTHGPKGYSTTSDSSGTYTITNIEPGYYWRTVTAPGYQRDRSYWRIQKDTDARASVKLVPEGIKVSLTNPTGGEDWKRGHTYEIRWDARGLDTVEITFRHWTHSTTLTRSVVGTWDRLPATPGRYSWQIPFLWGVNERPVEAGNYTIRVNGFKGGQYITFDESRQFTIN